ncbi:uncharacterized protein ARMOST_20478 [Armillaria ostoyae]|uniref:Uncharacterized protein n=1 Tax=Armillaria ostoyae TaxID=47428 RepID=A0A284S7G8_ARMOS|nr:uncharacterized protein ARMOST_20478 [Armillaria ostoyae]
MAVTVKHLETACLMFLQCAFDISCRDFLRIEPAFVASFNSRICCLPIVASLCLPRPFMTFSRRHGNAESNSTVDATVIDMPRSTDGPDGLCDVSLANSSLPAPSRSPAVPKTRLIKIPRLCGSYTSAGFPDSIRLWHGSSIRPYLSWTFFDAVSGNNDHFRPTPSTTSPGKGDRRLISKEIYTWCCEVIRD